MLINCLLIPEKQKTKNNHDLKISINHGNIKEIKNATVLGIVTHEFSRLNEHLDFISKKLVKCAAIVSRIGHFANLNSENVFIMHWSII